MLTLIRRIKRLNPDCRDALTRHISLSRRAAPRPISRGVVDAFGHESFSTLDPSVALYEQHQRPLNYKLSSLSSTVSSFGIDDKREAMKSFLESLENATTSFHSLTASYPSLMVNELQHLDNRHLTAFSSASPSSFAWEEEEEFEHNWGNSSLRNESMEQVSADMVGEHDQSEVINAMASNDFAATDEFIIDDEVDHDQDYGRTNECEIEESTALEPIVTKDTQISKHEFSRIHKRLKNAIRQKDLEKALVLFDSAMQHKEQNDFHLQLKTITSLYFLAVFKRPIVAMSIMDYLKSHPKFIKERKNVVMYETLCRSIRLLDPNTDRLASMHEFILKLGSDIDNLDATDPEMPLKKLLCPILVKSLIDQKAVSIGKYASEYYNFMVENDVEMKPSWLLSLLYSSKFSRQDDLPFHDVLARVVAGTSESLPPVPVLRAVQNMFPYTDTEAARVTLKAILDLIEREREQEQSDASNQREAIRSMHSKTNYAIDMGTLGAMSASAAQFGDTKLILMIWNVMDQLQERPNEVIYENSIITFASNKATVGDAFAAIKSMKMDGFEVSRALIRSISYAIRHTKHELRHALETLIGPEDLVSVEGLNAILSGFAERADVNHALNVLKEFEKQGMEPDVNTYAFAIEALGKYIRRRKSKLILEQSVIVKTLDKADEILRMMEEKNIEPSGDVIRNYVELLCLTDDVKTATGLVNDCLSTDEQQSSADEHSNASIETKRLVNNLTLYRVAIENAERGNFDTARQLASATSEPISLLYFKINKMERKLSKLQNRTEET